uniref:Ig-like domain-containing protein n=1 Tax=Amphilophus citrinellus TaxID=61819 RepID=A0A3Q0TCV8_AMPCI
MDLNSGPVVVQPGQSLTITCRVSGYSLTSYHTGWIRQRNRKQMEWILIMGTDGSDNTSAGTVTITGQNLQPEDTAVYYCARRDHTVIQTTDRPEQIPSNTQQQTYCTCEYEQ